MERQEDFVQTIEERVAKRVHVLMVMSPGADQTLGQGKDEPIGKQHPATINQEVGCEVDRGRHQDDRDGKFV